MLVSQSPLPLGTRLSWTERNVPGLASAKMAILGHLEHALAAACWQRKGTFCHHLAEPTLRAVICKTGRSGVSPDHVAQYQKSASESWMNCLHELSCLPGAAVSMAQHAGLFDLCAQEISARHLDRDATPQVQPTLVRIRVRRERQPGPRPGTQQGFWACHGAAEAWLGAGAALSLSTLCLFTAPTTS
jgi:hypothetical protein